MIIQYGTSSSLFSDIKMDDISGIDLVAAYKQSNQCEETERKLLSAMERLEAKETSVWSTINHSATYATSVFWQVCSDFL